MKIGFTGSRNGMSDNQKEYLEGFIDDLHTDITEVHHGACIGADAEFVLLVIRWRESRVIPVIIAHPPIEQTFLSKMAFYKSEQCREAKRFLERDHNIVDECDLLIAAPAQSTEQRRSGTWSTIRYARKAGKPIRLILP